MDLVWRSGIVQRWQHANHLAEDPSEFFTMIFGGEAFIDWYDSPLEEGVTQPGD